ncbi:MAG: hypothetical protein AB7G39_01430 [Alphaproteobacteria bacterium]
MRAWLSFSFDFRRLPPHLLLRLGAAEAALRALSAPLAPAWRTAREEAALLRVLAAALGPGASSAEALRGPPATAPHGVSDRRNAAAHALETALARPPDAALDHAAIEHYHRLAIAVTEPGTADTFHLVTQFRGDPGHDVSYRAILMQLCYWLEGPMFREAGEAAGAILAAAAALLHLQALQMFRYGNEIVAGCAAIHCLRRAGLPRAAALAVAEALPQAGSAAGLTAAVQAVLHYLEAEAGAWQARLDHLGHQDRLAELFGSRNDSGAARRRLLAAALLDKAAPVPLRRLRHCTPDIAAAYAGLSGRTILRDLDTLETMGLVQRMRGAVQAVR